MHKLSDEWFFTKFYLPIENLIVWGQVITEKSDNEYKKQFCELILEVLYHHVF